ncbi:RNA-binding domain-containing protein [Hathewaya histolytica]|uniref:Transcriptional regulator n=1 Tax=Hathewaya histolytica TaxID=1498 RepID=A0A4U9R1N4_HATHI|nr:RNA-binding domain-containing protein [Hathewaya histolytica]VTQ84889.1 transcriptional regulator [Hathewaya histolytica]
MNKKKLRNLLKKDENAKLDFKVKIDTKSTSSKKELAKDICAMANARGGRGYIIIGVEDKTKKIVGFDPTLLREEQIQQIVSSRCDPPIPIKLDYVNLNGKSIGVITIYDGDQKPYQVRYNGAFYIRRGSTTDIMRKEELVTLLSENLTFNAELYPITRSNIEHLDMKLVKQYFFLQGLQYNSSNIEELMINSGIVVKDKETARLMITLGGLLVFSRYNSIYIPQNKIKIINNMGDKEEILILSGKLLDILDKAEEYLNNNLPRNYPIIAIYEGLKNAILYRDYTVYDKIIEIKISNDNITLISPGCMDKNKGGKKNSYIKRNMWIYEKLIFIDNKKRFLNTGSGFSIIKNSFLSKGKKVYFLNSRKNNYFKISYPGIRDYV